MSSVKDCCDGSWVQTVQLNSQVFGLGIVVIVWLVACGSVEGERPNNKTINFF
jgi:hypothetical protein